MELQDFITGTLVAIAKGVESTDEQLKDLDAIVNPRNVRLSYNEHEQTYGELIDKPEREIRRSVEKISFDVSVVASSGEEAKGGVGILVASIGLGAQGRSESASSSTTRIQFSVPLVLPNGK